MADTPRMPPRGSRPRGRTGPGRGPGSGAARTGRSVPAGPAGSTSAGTIEAPRSRLTGRAAILVLVIAALAVSYASSLRAYLDLRTENNSLQEQIAERSASIDSLEREKDRWSDKAYQRSQARERLGYVMPGETAYVVLDEDGNPLESESSLSDPAEVLAQTTPTAWWEEVWGSVELAGRPPRAEPPPLTEIDGSQQP